MRFELSIVALAATSVVASEAYAPPPSYGGNSPAPAPAPAPPAYGGQPSGTPEQPPYGGPEQPPYGGPEQPSGTPEQPPYGGPEQPPYGGPEQPSGTPEQPPYGGEQPVPTPSCSEGHPEPTGPPSYGSETEAPVPSSTDDCEDTTSAPAPTETPCLGYDCPMPHPGDYTTYTTCITTSPPCDGGEKCPPVTITSTIVEPCPPTSVPVTTTTYVTKPCPSCEEETITSTITITETAPAGYPTGGVPSCPGGENCPPPSGPTGGVPACPGGENCPPSTLVPQPSGTGAPVCPGGGYSCGAEGNSTSPVPDVPYGSGASRFTGSVAASLVVFLTAAFML